MDAAAEARSLTPARDRAWLAANARARESLAMFVRLAWPILNPGTPLQWNWHVDAICEHLVAVTRGEIQQLVINVPPGTSKTTCASVCWPAWEWLRSPGHRWLFAAYASDLSIRDNVARRRLITSEWYRCEMAPEFELTGDVNLKTQFENDRFGWMKATATGAGIIGWHADRQVIDDPIKSQAIYGAGLVEHVRWYFETFASRVRDGARRVLVMQRVHGRDLANALLETGQWEHLCLPAEYRRHHHCSTSIGWEDPRTKEGDLLDPVRMSKTRLEEIRLGGDSVEPGMGTRMYQAQYQQDPAGDEGNVVNRTWWRHYALDRADVGDDRPELPDELEDICGSVDATFKKSADSDYVVIQVWGRAGTLYYLLDQHRERMGFVATEAALVAMADKWPECRRWLIEDAANGPAIVDRLRGSIPGIVAVRVRESKEARLQAVSALIEAGQVHLPLPKDGPWVVVYIEEMAAFPRGDYDDQVDATSMALASMSARARMFDLPEVRNLRRQRGPVRPFAGQTAADVEAGADSKRMKMGKKGGRLAGRLARLAKKTGERTVDDWLNDE